MSTGQPILLVAGAASRQSGTRVSGKEMLTLCWQVDETVIALTRAAISKGIPLVVPLDTQYAPLVAQVAAEYASPEVAEGASRNRFGSARDDGMRAISFVSLSKASDQIKPGNSLNWMDVFRNLKVVSDEVQTLGAFLERTRPQAVVGVGQGPRVNALLKAARSTQVPQFRLAAGLATNGRRKMASESFERGIERELVGLRRQLTLTTVGEGSRLRGRRDERTEEPPFFHAYPPLALYAQMLLDNLAAYEEG